MLIKTPFRVVLMISSLSLGMLSQSQWDQRESMTFADRLEQIERVLSADSMGWILGSMSIRKEIEVFPRFIIS